MSDLWASPIAERVERLQNEGRNVWIWGFSADGRYALIADADNDTASIAHVDTPSDSLGRWEHHLSQLDTAVYGPRFPVR